MLKTILLLFIGFLPSLWSLWVLRKNQQRASARRRQVTLNYSQIESYIRPFQDDCAEPINEGDRYYLEGVGYLIGDISCKFNARSGYVRCAVNPSGPCQHCHHYEPRELTSSKQI